jgi:DNA-binding CsgD family transcriptional regulator
MVGRADAVDELRALFDATSLSGADLPTVALVAGEAGIGKTRLVREFLTGLPDGSLVLFGYGDQNGVNRSLSMLHDTVGSEWAERDRSPVDVAEALRSIADGRRAVLVLEDLHWADADSAAVVDRLVTSPWPNVLVVGTYRPDDLSRRLPGGDLLARLERRATVERLHLDRLSRNELTSFVTAVYGDVPGSAVIEALYNRTGGNPFFLEELLTCYDVSSAGHLVDVPLPWSLQEVVERQLDGLDPVERHVAEVAAVCGTASRFDVLAEVAGVDEEQLITVLRGLIERGLLMETGGERFVFRHALVRDAVEGALLGRQRRRLHERALAALQRIDAPSDELADHALGAGRFEDFVVLARTAADAFMENGQSFAALRMADAALREAPDDQDLLYLACRSAWLAGLLDEAAAYAAQWVQAAVDANDPAAEASALRWSSRIEFDIDRPDSQAAFMDRVIALLDRLDDHERARALAWIAQYHMLRDRNVEAIAAADEAIELAERVGEKGVVLQARIERASARIMEAGPAAVPELLAAIDEAEAASEFVLVTRGLNNVLQEVWPGSPEGRAIIQRFRRAAEKAGFDMMSTSTVVLHMAELASIEADMDRARRLFDQLTSSFSRCGGTRKMHALFEFHLASEEGCEDRAREARDVMLANLVEPSKVCLPMWLDLEYAAMTHDIDALQAALAKPLARDAADVIHSVQDVFQAVDATLRGGLSPEFVRTELDPWLQQSRHRAELDSVIEGLLFAAEQRPADAAARLLTGLSDTSLRLPRYQIEYLRTLAASQVALTGDRQGARLLVTQALDGLSRWPGWRRDQAEALARRLDGRSAPDSSLSAREAEVAKLLAEGITNAELARRLYISPRTAAVHVSNILMKLNMSSRAEVAAWAVRTGLVES